MDTRRENSLLSAIAPRACRRSSRAVDLTPHGRAPLGWGGRFPGSRRLERPPSERAARAFTLVEMVVVIAVVLVLLGLLLPAASTLWKERRLAETVNILQGMLMTGRAQAMQTDGFETGFLAFVDREGAQRLVSITRFDPIDSMDPDEFRDLDPADIPVIRAAHQNVFRVTDAPDQILPPPIRVVPRYAVEVEDPATDRSYERFSELELANDDFGLNPPRGDQAQRHRNFFTMVFSTSGELVVWRDVLIQDADGDDPPDGFGDRTGLPVGPAPPDTATLTAYYSRTTDAELAIDPRAGTPVRFLVRDNPLGTVATNFPSVDGLLVYDDSIFSGLAAAEQRDFLLEYAQPLYVSRWTGAVVRGPVGETPRETP